MTPALDRRHFRADGQPKIRYATRTYAKAIRRRLRAAGDKAVMAYHCPVCEGYHVGRSAFAKDPQQRLEA